MESSSTLGKSNSTEGFVDGLSSLPDDIALHLLSFLDVADLVSLMLLSKRLYSLCMSVPVLSVDNRKHLTSNDHYECFVGKFLALRQKTGTEVHKLNFTWQFYRGLDLENSQDELHRLVSYCIRTVLCCGTQCLCLGFFSPERKPQHLPPPFFYLTQTLKELMIRTNNCRLHISPTAPFQPPMLEKLTIQSSKLTEGEIQNLVMALPSLKSLILLFCTGIKTLAINSSSLKLLKIINDSVVELNTVSISCPHLQKLHIVWLPSSDATPVFNILQSNELKEFLWYGVPLGSYFSSTSVHMQSATVFLELPSTLPIPWLLSQASKPLMDMVINQLSVTKSLTLSSVTLKLFHIRNCSSSPLSKVESLSVEFCLISDIDVPAISFFLRGLLHLKSLCIESSSVSQKTVDKFRENPTRLGGYKVEYWETQDLKFVPQLKMATIEVCGEGNGLELVKYLLKHATALETLNILCVPALELSILEKIMQYKSTQSTTVFFTSIFQQRKLKSDFWRNLTSDG